MASVCTHCTYVAIVQWLTYKVVKLGIIVVTNQIDTMMSVVQLSHCDVGFIILHHADGNGWNPNGAICLAIWHHQEVLVLSGRACTTAVTMLDISSVVKGPGENCSGSWYSIISWQRLLQLCVLYCAFNQKWSNG